MFHNWEWLQSCCIAKHLFPNQIWVKGYRRIYSCMAYLGQVDLVEIIPLQSKPKLMSFNLKTHFGHKCVIVDYIRETLCQQSSSTMPCQHCTGPIHSYGTQFTPLCQLTVDTKRRFIYSFNPVRYLATLLNRKVWWENLLSHQ